MVRALEVMCACVCPIPASSGSSQALHRSIIVPGLAGGGDMAMATMTSPAVCDEVSV